MTGGALHNALQRLYDKSATFPVSIDTIQRLAKHLVLDTFVETEVEGAPPGVTRLSIAGSLLLLELDFTNDSAVANVSLSVSSHGSTDTSLAQDTAQEYFSVDEASLTVRVKTGGRRYSFLSTTDALGKSEVDAILLRSLTGPTLGAFPANLKYLADLDRLSPPEGDLISYLDKISLALHALQGAGGSNEASEGSTNPYGKVLLNDGPGNRVGVFLQYWRPDSVSASLNQEPQEMYTAVLGFEESPQAMTVLGAKYTATAHGKQIHLDFADSFDFADVLDSASKKVCLVLSLDQPVYLPETRLDYLGINRYQEDENPDASILGFLEEVLKTGEVTFEPHNGVPSSTVVFADKTKLVPVKSLCFHDLHQLEDIIPSLRSMIVFSNILHSIASHLPSVPGEKQYFDLSANATKRIKNSLKLSNEVPDEELLGLTTISTDYMGLQMLDSTGGLNETESMDEMVRDDSVEAAERADHVTVSLEEYRFDGAAMSIALAVAVELEGKSFQTLLSIENGIIAETTPTSTDSDMDVDSGTGARFARALALSENVPLAVRALH